MLRKGLVKNMTTMILILMTGGVVAATLGGPLYGAMEEGYNEIQQFLGIADRTELSKGEEYSARDKLAAITHYAWDRAHSCDQVDETIANGGYGPLQETSYGDEPPCSGQGGSLVASLYNLGSNTGNDMEGKFSRVNFVVKDEIVLESSEQYGVHDGWEGAETFEYENGDTQEIENRFRFLTLSKSGQSFQKSVAQECGGWESMSAEGVPVLFTDTSNIEQRYTLKGEARTWQGLKQLAQDKKEGFFGAFRGVTTDPYCGGLAKTGFLVNHKFEERINGEKGSVELKLCPGDKGYVQVNKGFAFKNGEFTGYNIVEEAFKGNTRYFPYIQITEVNASRKCDTSASKIPEGANSQGSELEISADRNPDTIDVDNFRLEKTGRRACRVSLTEKDVTGYTSENGYVEYRAGTVLPKGGKFPKIGSDLVVNSELQEKDGLIEDYGTRELYDFLSTISGLNGQPVDSENAPLLNSVGVQNSGSQELEMYGDLLCVQNQNDYQQPQWVACDESVSDLNSSEDRELTVRTSDQGFPLNFRCNMQAGEWELHSTGRTCEAVRQNGPPSDKIDVVFYGGQFDSVENLRSNASYLVDWNGDNQGLMSVEPFASNRDRFNFWAVNSTDPIPLDNSNPGAFDRRNALLTPRLACGADRTDEIVVLSRREGRSYAFSPTNATAGGSWDREAYVYIGNGVETESVQLSELFRSSEDMERRLGVTPEELDISLEDATIRLDNDSQNDPRTFVHEFGHSFGGLQDEYTEFGARDDPGRPNCADDRQQAEQWWGELAGEEESVDYFEGCSYVNSNVRPTIMSLMYIQFFDSYDFELVNERRLERVIENYDTGDES